MPAPTRPFDLPDEIERLLGRLKVDFPSEHQQPSHGRLAIATVASLGGSLLSDVLLVAIGTGLFASTKHYAHFAPSDYGKLTIIGVIIACAAWPVVTWISSAPRWLFLRLAMVVTLFLWLPDLYILFRGQPPKAVAVLMTMHLGIALVTYNALVRIAPGGRGQNPSASQPSPYATTTSLEALGSPSQGDAGSDQGCYGYQSVSDGAQLRMAGVTYRQGFQVSTNITCDGTWRWTWHIGGLYRTLTATVGLDATNSRPASLAFMGPKGKPLAFRAEGRSVNELILYAGIPTNISLEVKGDQDLVVTTTTAGVTVDFANDKLSA